MNQGRYQSLLNSLSASDKKLFECLPKQDFWDMSQINAEFIRRYLHKPNFASVELVVKTLTERGLVTRTNNKYQQVKVTEPMTKEPTLVLRAAVPLTLVQRLTLISNQMLDLAGELGELVKEVEKVSEPTEELLKLRKLKEALSIFKD